jgi:hypothetical protein
MICCEYVIDNVRNSEGTNTYLKALYFYYEYHRIWLLSSSMVRLLIASSSPLRELCPFRDSRAGQPSVDNLNPRLY